MPSAEPDVVLCVDFGSTFTKTSLIDLAEGRILAAAEHRTTIDTDVLDGYDACLAALVAQDPRAADAPSLACSSAGGGLRIAVCCAGTGWAQKVAGSKGPHPLLPFETIISINLIGTFNVLRFASAAMIADLAQR